MFAFHFVWLSRAFLPKNMRRALRNKTVGNIVSSKRKGNLVDVHNINLCIQHLRHLEEPHITKENLDKIADSVDGIKKSLFFDLQIKCSDVILPCHKNVLSIRSSILRNELSSGIKVLDWTEYNGDIGLALIRWFYDEIVDLKSDDFALDILCASFRFELSTLFKACERMLIMSVKKSSAHKFLAIAERVGAKALVKKCLRIRSIRDDPSLDLLCETGNTVKSGVSDENEAIGQHPIESVNEVCVIAEKKEQLKKIINGIMRYLSCADISIWICSRRRWPANASVLRTYSDILRNEINEALSKIDQTYSFRFSRNTSLALLRWIYTGVVDLNNDELRMELLIASHKFELWTLFDICEVAIGSTANISRVAKILHITKKIECKVILHYCKYLLNAYWEELQSHNLNELPKIILNSNNHLHSTQLAITECAMSGDSIMVLNDDCLLDIFFILPLVDLSSIKTTCQRFCMLADQCFRNYKDKTISINDKTLIADIWNLQQFGQFIDSLILADKNYWSKDDIYAIVVKFCKSKLKAICINLNNDFNVANESLNRLQGILRNVEILQLQNFYNIRQIELLLSYCENLKEFHVEGKEMEMENFWCYNYRKIKRITMTCMMNDDVVEEISQKMLHLEYLDFSCNFGTGKMIHLALLENLKALRIGSHYDNIVNVLQHLGKRNLLEYLALTNFEMNELIINALGAFTKLKELTMKEITNYIPDPFLHILSRNIPNIKKLVFDSCLEITFANIISIIGHNKKKLKELLIIDCHEIDFIDIDYYAQLRKHKNLIVFLNDLQFKETMKLIANNLTASVQISKIPPHGNYWGPYFRN